MSLIFAETTLGNQNLRYVITWLHTRAFKYNVSVHVRKGKMYLLQLYLVTMETFVVQRSRSWPLSMVYTTLENILDQ